MQTGSLIHLAQRLERAHAECAPAPAAAREGYAWHFDEPRLDWRPVSSDVSPGLASMIPEPLPDSLRLSLVAPEQLTEVLLMAGLVVDVGDRSSDAWTGLRVRARATSHTSGILATSNVGDGPVPVASLSRLFSKIEASPIFTDGSVQDYFLPFLSLKDEPPGDEGEARMLRDVAIFFGAPGPASLDVLSITLVPRGAAFLESHGVHSLTRESITRSTLFAHTPAELTWRVRIPESGRLDLGLTCQQGEPVSYRVTVTSRSGERVSVFEELVDQASVWTQRSLDLAGWSGEVMDLTLGAESDVAGSVALWGAPILSGPRRSARPNVVFYVIDGGGADLMSVYGYNRRTTPYLERLAAEGVVFERAYSNSTWTQPSTASFMTSLHHSVLGGLRRGVHSTLVPDNAVTMAEHMSRAGYETAAFTSNPNAARVIGLERGVDVMRDVAAGPHSTSSAELHEWFWNFRSDYPGYPYWVHIQTTDVHEPHRPVAPFAGLFVSPEDQARLNAADTLLTQEVGDSFFTTSVAELYEHALEGIGIDRRSYFNACRGLYDETMAHQDRELARFVQSLKDQGEWENTLLVIAADHGHPACTFARFGRGLIEPRPETWQGALFDSYYTHVPLIFIWPDRIEGGRRFEQAVSMIDVLPTVLALCGLPAPEVAQGRSLAPLLLGEELAPRPVILDEFRVDETTGQMVGNIEMIDGRWGASLEIGPNTGSGDTALGRHSIPAGGRFGAAHTLFPEVSSLLLYDLSRDAFATHAVNDEHPELVERYRRALLAQWQNHRALAQRFGRVSEDRELTTEMLEQLQALGYVR